MNPEGGGDVKGSRGNSGIWNRGGGGDGGGGNGGEEESTDRRKSMSHRLRLSYRPLVFDGTEPSLFVLPLLMSILFINLQSASSTVSASPGINRRSATTEYCQSETFEAKCRTNQRIIISRAEYGRMRSGKCVEANLGPVSMIGETDYIGCKADVLSIADSMCSGRRTCEIRVPNIEMDKTEPCFKELKTYLEIESICVTVAVGDSQFCGGSHHQIQLVADEGYLSSDVSYSTNCGSSATPWVIDALPGQRVNVTLLDLTNWRSSGQTSRTTVDDGGANNCIPLGYVVERNAGTNQTICGGREREALIYSSHKNSVEIYFLEEKTEGLGPRFMIHYKTVGCPDLKPPASAWYKRDGDTAVVGCEDTDKTWHLVCRNNRWSGVVGNCSAFRGFLSPLPIRGHFSLSNGLSIAVVMGIAVLIAIIILVIGLIYVTAIRKQSKEQLSSHQLMLPNRSSGVEEAYKSNYRVIRLEDGSSSLAGTQRQISREVTLGEAGLQTTDAGNDYAHIWETPLLEPIGADGNHGDPIDSRGAYSSTPRQARSPRGPEKQEAESEGDVCDAPSTRAPVSSSRSNDKCDCDTSAEVVGPISVSRYFLLEKRSIV